MKYMVCVDGSVYSDLAFRRVLGYANKEKDEVLLLAVEQSIAAAASSVADAGYTVVSTMLDTQKSERERIFAVLDRYKGECERHTLKVSEVVAEGSPNETIVLAAKEKEADIIVLGTRGLGTLERWLLGSTSDYVTEHAPCSVWVVHAKEDELERAATPSPLSSQPSTPEVQPASKNVAEVEGSV